jgi:uncharacterized membrane protein
MVSTPKTRTIAPIGARLRSATTVACPDPSDSTQPHPAPPKASSSGDTDTEVQHAASGEFERLIFLCDGVFAIAMTLLAVELALPQITSQGEADLAQRLSALGPRYFSYALSFLVIATYWLSHQRIFRNVVRVDIRFVWLNVLLLMCVAFLPFPTSVIGNYGNDVAAVTLYAGTLAVTGLVLFAMWVYAAVGRRLLSQQVSAGVVQRYTVRLAAAPLIFLASIGIAQFDTNIAKFSWIAIAVVLNVLGWIYRKYI